MVKLVSSLTLAAVVAAPAFAQASDPDVRCVVAGNAFGAAEKDPAKRQLALATALFFAGRVDARLSPAQLKAQVAAQGNALTVDTIAPVMTACAKSFQAKERAMQAIGEEIARSHAAKAPVAAPPKK